MKQSRLDESECFNNDGYRLLLIDPNFQSVKMYCYGKKLSPRAISFIARSTWKLCWVVKILKSTEQEEDPASKTPKTNIHTHAWILDYLHGSHSIIFISNCKYKYKFQMIKCVSKNSPAQGCT